MKRLVVILVSLLVFAACKSRTQAPAPNRAVQLEIARLDSLVQTLQQQNAAQEERIKDLEEDLEGVITFLGNEMDY